MPIQYKPLEAQRNNVRLLEIHPPTEFCDVPSGYLLHYSLDDESLPDYCALSYVWGSALDTKTILVDDSEVYVTQNLFYALQCMSSKVEEWSAGRLLLWVDAICINQDDLIEKASQIPLMARIYSSAHTVLAHLGLGNEKTAHAMETIYSIYPHIAKHISREDTTLSWMEQLPGLWQAGEVGEYSIFWTGVRDLMACRYWSRAWVLQEMALASQMLLLTGGDQNPTREFAFDALLFWHAFVFHLRAQPGNPLPRQLPSLLWTMASHMYATAAFSVHLVTDFQHDFREARKTGTLVQKTRMTDLSNFYKICSNFCATDPRDLIYAYLGLMDLDIQVDYSESMSVRKLYTHFAAKCIQDGGASRLLCFSGIGWNSQNTYQLPSWVPDWQYLSSSSIATTSGVSHLPHPHNILMGDRRYAANDGMRGRLQHPVMANDILCTQGCIVDIISEPCRFYPTSSESGLNADQMEALFEICVSFISRSSNIRAPALQVLFRTILQDMYILDGAESRLYADNPMRVLSGALSFLACVVDPFHQNIEHITGRLRQLGYDTSTESYRDFLQRVFFAGNNDPLVLAILDAIMNGTVTIPIQHGTTLEDVLDMGSETMRKFQASQRYFPTVTTDLRGTMLLLIDSSLSNNLLIEISDGRMAMVPPETKEGDLLCVLANCDYPVVLTRTGDVYLNIGPCYAFGLMDGEAADMIKTEMLEMQDFMIA